MIPDSIVISAPGTGEGKTLICSALARAFVLRGIRVQPYKIGPDYIDGRFYDQIAGRPAYNVDLWLDGERKTRDHIDATRGDAQILLFEGMMGLYDGDDEGSTSTAHVARLLDAPVVLVMDCWRASQTIAAVALGLRSYDPAVRILGIILNRVGGEAHERAIRTACAAHSLPILATTSYDPALQLEERRLGLDTRSIATRVTAIERLARHFACEVGLEPLYSLVSEGRSNTQPPSAPTCARIAYAHDGAFWFTYPETLEALRQSGAELVPFSPLADEQLPSNVCGLWIGGGYPEDVAAELESNHPMRSAIAKAIAAGMPTYAECGGMMYLAERLTTKDGTFTMVGALRGVTSIDEPTLTIGYRSARIVASTPFDEARATIRGYEFHYARATLDETPAYSFEDGRTDGASRPTLLAGFVHRHFVPGDPSIERFVQRCALSYQGQ